MKLTDDMVEDISIWLNSSIGQKEIHDALNNNDDIKKIINTMDNIGDLNLNKPVL